MPKIRNNTPKIHIELIRERWNNIYIEPIKRLKK